ncbi:MAG: hypothetical protein IJ681_09580, partial [Bacteroidales bacterium]|nr:hypothetical protein [Bacteroidales bacterium]
LTPAWGLWYLLCLIYWRIIIQFTPDKILSHKKLVLCVSVLLSVLIVSVRFGWSILSYQRFFGLLPFFMAGYYARQTDIVDKIKKINPAICVFVLSGIVIALILSGNRIDVLLQHAAYFNNKDYYDMNDTFMRMQLRILMLVIATVMSVCVINVCRYMYLINGNLSDRILYCFMFIIC